MISDTAKKINMLKYNTIFCGLFLSVLCWSSSIEAIAEGPFIKASITVDVELKLPEGITLEPDRGMVTALGSGVFMLDFVFEKKLVTETLMSEGQFQLTHYQSFSYGTAKDCSVSLSEKEYRPRTVNAQCTLSKSIGSEENGAGDTITSKMIQFRLTELPHKEMVQVEWDCGGVKKVMSDPAILTQLYLPFFAESWNFSLDEQNPHVSTRRNYSLHNGTVADLTFVVTLKPMEPDH